MSHPQDLLTPEMKRVATAFRLGTGIPCFYIDNRGRRILPNTEPNDTKAFCRFCLKHVDGSCEQVCLYGRYQAERFGGKYIYFCPSGLTYCVSPVFSDQTGISALFAGPMLMIEADEFLLEDLVHPLLHEENSTPEANREAIRDHFSELPVEAALT